MTDMKKSISAAKDKCLSGQVLTKEEIVELLDIPVGSPDDILLRKTAHEVALKITEGDGLIWTAVGMDYAPCEMNCSFCSFAENLHIIKENRYVTEEEIFESVKRFVEGGAAFVILRTTEFFSIDDLLALIPKIREKVPGDYVMAFNTGEMSPEIADKVASGGVYGAYHARRLREGVDTPFDPEVRLNTMKSIGESKLKLFSHVEPIGPEHTSEELAERFLDIVACKASMSGLMARFPVAGSPFENVEIIDDETIAHITAVLRLSGGDVIKDICSYPSSLAATTSGSNCTVVECGAIPRDAVYSESDWAKEDMASARRLLEDAGYHIAYVRDR